MDTCTASPSPSSYCILASLGRTYDGPGHIPGIASRYLSLLLLPELDYWPQPRSVLHSQPWEPGRERAERVLAGRVLAEGGELLVGEGEGVLYMHVSIYALLQEL